MTKYIPIAGTWERDDDDPNEQPLWWRPENDFAKFMLTHNFQQALVQNDPFVWGADLDGVDITDYFTRHENYQWRVAGEMLATYLKGIPLIDRNIIAHSHGGQVALFAASSTCPINRLLTVSTPVRKDMEAQIEVARPSITHWTHVHSDWTDVWQIAGELFDGRIGIVRDMKKADNNIMIPQVGHSDILYKPTSFHYWDDFGLFQYLKDQS